MPGTRFRSGGDRSKKQVRQTSGEPITKPATLTSGGSRKWDSLIQQIPAATLAQLDEHNLGLLAELLAQSEQLSAAIDANPADAPTRRLFLNTVDRITRLSALFGLDPASRARLKLDPDSKPENDPFLAFLKAGREPSQ
jgi:hypothetical protein